MRVFKVPDALAAKCHGAGFALAAITGGQLIGVEMSPKWFDIACPRVEKYFREIEK